MTHPFVLPLPPIRPLPTGDGAAYELTEPLRWVEPDGTAGEVAPPFVTDLATVPAPVRILAPTSGLHTPAAIRHDRRCDDLNAWHRAWVAAGRPAGPPVEHDGVAVPHLDSRATDREFREGVRDLDPRRPLRAWAMWLGVRLGAVANPARRAGVAADLPLMLLVLLVIAPLYLPVGVVNAVALLIDRAANACARLARRTRRRLLTRHRLPG